MNESFEILDGKLFMDKKLFAEAQHSTNNITYLSSLSHAQMFQQAPDIHTGLSSVTIDYHNAVNMTVPRNLDEYITELKDTYQNQLRGSLKVCSNNRVFEVVISKF